LRRLSARRRGARTQRRYVRRSRRPSATRGGTPRGYSMLPASRPSIISRCPAAHGRGASGRRRASCRGGGRAAGLAWARLVEAPPLRASRRVGVYSSGSGGSGGGGDSASANDSSGGGNPPRSEMELDYDEDSSGRSGGARRQEQPPVPPRPPEASPLTPPFPEVWTPRTVLERYPRPCGRELRGRGAALAGMSKDHRERSGTGLLRSQGAGIRPPTTTTDTTRLATHKTTRAAPCAEGGQERQTGGHAVRTDTPQGRGRIRHGGPRVRVCVSGWCETKQTRHSTDGRHCGQQQTTARGGQGALPCPPTASSTRSPKQWHLSLDMRPSRRARPRRGQRRY